MHQSALLQYLEKSNQANQKITHSQNNQEVKKDLTTTGDSSSVEEEEVDNGLEEANNLKDKKEHLVEEVVTHGPDAEIHGVEVDLGVDMVVLTMEVQEVTGKKLLIIG